MSDLKPIVLTLALTFFIGLCQFKGMAEEPTTTKSITDQITALQKKRIGLLEKNVELIKVYHQQGRISMSLLHAAQKDLLDAQFEIANTNKEKIELTQKQLKIAKEISNQIQRKLQFGLDAAGKQYHAQAYVLELEIQLLKLQQLDEKPKAITKP